MNIVSSSAMVMIVTFQLIWSTIVFKITSIFFFYLLIRHTSCNLSMSPSLDLLNVPFHFKSPVYCEAVLLGFKRQNGLNVILKHENAQLPESISWLGLFSENMHRILQQLPDNKIVPTTPAPPL